MQDLARRGSGLRLVAKLSGKPSGEQRSDGERRCLPTADEFIRKSFTKTADDAVMPREGMERIELSFRVGSEA